MENMLISSVSVPDNVLVRELAGESVLLNLGSESYFGLDPVGTQMWAALTTTFSVGAAFDQLLNEYDVDPERLRGDLHAFIDKMRQHGLLDVKAG